MRTNRYASKCSTCPAFVAEGMGTIENVNGKWITKCAKCGGIVEGAKPRISVAMTEGRVLIKPVDFLSGTQFAAYRGALTGAAFDPTVKAQVAKMEKLPGYLAALAQSFVVVVAPEVAAALQAHEAEMQALVANVSLVASKVDLELKARGLALFPFQREGAKWLVTRKNALLADDMGLGKTIQVLMALPANAPVLVIAPSVAKGVWAAEAAKWRPDFKVTKLSGRGSFRFPVSGEMVITNYDILPKAPAREDEKALEELTSKAPKGFVLVGDEFHYCKNAKTARTAAFRALSVVASKVEGCTWALTATPLLNRPQELWSVLQSAGLAREAFGSWDRFCTINNAYSTRFGMEWGQPTQAVAEGFQKVSLRRVKRDVLPQLPIKTYREVTVDLNAATSKWMAKFEAASKAYTRWSMLKGEPTPEETVGPCPAPATSGHLTSFEGLSEAMTKLAEAKLPALLDLVEEYEEQDEPLVVFSAHRCVPDSLATRPGWAVITGDTKSDDRQAIQEAFQAGKLKGIAGTIQAMGVALTLTRASNVVFVDRDWTPALNRQAEDRVLRIGQTRGVLIMTLVADCGLDRRVTELLTQKAELLSQTTEAEALSQTTPQTVDLEALALQAKEEDEKAEAARLQAEERIAHYATLNEEEKAKVQEETKARKRAIREERWMSRAGSASTPRHLPSSPEEQWMCNAINQLTNDDPDRAQVENFIGFSASDGSLGHELTFLVNNIGLTDHEWDITRTLCRKYHRQVGTFQ